MEFSTTLGALNRWCAALAPQSGAEIVLELLQMQLSVEPPYGSVFN
jgi:hypothetical protein